MKDQDDLSRICSIIHLNNTTFFKRTSNGRLDHIRFTSSDTNKKDRFLNNVLESMLLNNWQSKLGLSINDVMQLDFNEYTLMDERLKKFKESLGSNAENVLNELTNGM